MFYSETKKKVCYKFYSFFFFLVNNLALFLMKNNFIHSQKAKKVLFDIPSILLIILLRSRGRRGITVFTFKGGSFKKKQQPQNLIKKILKIESPFQKKKKNTQLCKRKESNKKKKYKQTVSCHELIFS